MTHQIVSQAHLALRRTAAPVAPSEIPTREFQSLIDDMFRALYQCTSPRGMGLAAPQVGVSKRLFVVDLQQDGFQPICLVNPALVAAEGEAVSIEGCLSLPSFAGKVKRSASVTLTGQDRKGRARRIEASGLLAYCLQHELDHLNGVLYVDLAETVRPLADYRAPQKHARE
ncbi:MAG: peptide deformylase [bacterium]|nr:peptide deformylase [bacterium]